MLSEALLQHWKGNAVRLLSTQSDLNLGKGIFTKLADGNDRLRIVMVCPGKIQRALYGASGCWKKPETIARSLVFFSTAEAEDDDISLLCRRRFQGAVSSRQEQSFVYLLYQSTF
nr:hypothetical protein Iba_scaffold34950CG0020 [Ipomoea batatas]GMD74900.1 hypothetical protein Iba_chr13aCG9750 [Ipomoea batatas]GMD81361.1 hypothetical protein Iba_chr13eCG10880 [Ipomoea batatas]GMD82634.1 hypothetical protein Iba_chr13fCG9940 [Ipomoea batatas]